MRAGLTQEKLAQIAGYSKRTIEKLETGGSVLPKTLQDIAKALNVDAVSIFASVPESENLESVVAEDDSPIAGPLTVYIDANEYTAEEQGELLSLLSELYSLQRNDRLIIDKKGIAESQVEVPVSPDGGGLQ